MTIGGRSTRWLLSRWRNASWPSSCCVAHVTPSRALAFWCHFWGWRGFRHQCACRYRLGHLAAAFFHALKVTFSRSSAPALNGDSFWPAWNSILHFSHLVNVPQCLGVPHLHTVLELHPDIELPLVAYKFPRSRYKTAVYAVDLHMSSPVRPIDLAWNLRSSEIKIPRSFTSVSLWISTSSIQYVGENCHWADLGLYSKRLHLSGLIFSRHWLHHTTILAVDIPLEFLYRFLTIEGWVNLRIIGVLWYLCTFHMCWEVFHVEGKHQTWQRWPLWYAWHYIVVPWVSIAYTYPLPTSTKETPQPTLGEPSDAITRNLQQ